jgi:hypothetical protein
MRTKTTHQIIILKDLLDGKIVTSIDSIASNRNQYFKPIKQQGIELIEVYKANLTNNGKHKERTLNQTIDNINRAKKYLKRLQGKI